MNVADLLLLPTDIVPDHRALGEGSTTITYEELSSEVAATARWLSSQGIGAGNTIATSLGFSSEFVVLMVAALALGAEVAPLSERAKSEEFADLVQDLRPDLLVCGVGHEERAAAALRRLEKAPLVAWADEVRRPVTAGDRVEVTDLPDGSVAIVLHTSGTTGRPKPVRLQHDGIARALLRSAEPPDGGDRGATLLAVPNHHVAGIMSLLISLYSGRCVQLLPAFTVSGWTEQIAAGGVTHAFVVPTMLQRIVDAPDFEPASLAGLRTLAYGAAPMPRRVILDALEKFPDSCGFVASYGQTETGGTVCILDDSDHRAARDGESVALERLSSIGRPVPDTVIAVLDDDGQPLGPQATGEIALRSSADDGAGWHRTGDQGYLDADGYVYLSGRLDDLIIRAGENIDPVEVEEALATHPAVAEVAVAGLPDEEWGQLVGAFVVRRPGMDPTTEELVTHVKDRLASFKAPSHVVFVEALPRTDLGKVKRKMLALESAATGGPAPAGEGTNQ